MSHWPDELTTRARPADWAERGEALPPRPPAGYAPLPDRPDRSSERAARLTLTCLAASVAVLAIGAVVFVSVHTLREKDRASTSAAPKAPPSTTPEDATRAIGGIGPAPGTDAVTYGQARNAALAKATGVRVAVISFWNYTTDAKAHALVGSDEVLAELAAAPGGQPDVVTGDIATWATNQTADARSQRDAIQQLIPTVDDPQFLAFYKSEVVRLNKIIAGVNPAGNLVFGIVVRADATNLQQLATNSAVRLVDVGDSADPGPKPVYRGFRPEETSKADDPNVRPSS